MTEQDKLQDLAGLDYSYQVLMETLNLFLDQLIENEAKGELKASGWSLDKINSLFELQNVVHIPQKSFDIKSEIIPKREMLEMVSSFFKSLGPDVNKKYLRCLINLMNSRDSTIIYDLHKQNRKEPEVAMKRWRIYDYRSHTSFTRF